MAILLDSASLDDAATAAGVGFIRGFTTNPLLMAREATAPLERFGRLLTVLPDGPAFFQPTGSSTDELVAGAHAATRLAPERVVVKLPATSIGIAAAARLVDAGTRCALTAVYTPAQALLAHEVGCGWAIPYVDRAARQSAGGLALIDALAAVLDSRRSDTRVLAASLKSAQQVVDAVLHGADDVTAPLSVLLDLPDHPLSDAAAREFDAAAREPDTAAREPDTATTT